MSFFTINPNFADTSQVGPSEVTPSISAPWSSPFAVGSGASATATQTTADPGTLAAIAPNTGSNATVLYLGLGLLALIGAVLVSGRRK